MVEIESHLDSNQTRDPGKFANPLRCVKRVFYLGGERCLGLYSTLSPQIPCNAMTLQDLLLTTYMDMDL
jgi:hypothetical protein